MISQSVIDEVTLWFSATILSDPAHETDRMVIDRMAAETSRQPLSDVIAELQEEHREDSGAFRSGSRAGYTSINTVNHDASSITSFDTAEVHFTTTPCPGTCPEPPPAPTPEPSPVLLVGSALLVIAAILRRRPDKEI